MPEIGMNRGIGGLPHAWSKSSPVHEGPFEVVCSIAHEVGRNEPNWLCKSSAQGTEQIEVTPSQGCPSRRRLQCSQQASRKGIISTHLSMKRA
jgi:hypothetical protein